ncbi:D-threo-3-hydroxyaspartate dehydratase [Pseudovibrio axinellae]|uniref:D-threo-3-hydroxyaspartate dehydratase n=1 Tax=Pseudovibrio axinellae TaxID=989403 RepID=A0A165YR58_9HYPH|nr:alanine racemase [Pseudovibrio axinellae]KZL19145.1 D-threo-3-hydroxyaspartate dehydratase [Pseudovibrio axinellae]SER34669.1 D-serine deaminase, pyridoxal phosphate-dependent [Pseudovibrio axinellae]
MLEHLHTPCLLLDETVLRANIKGMADRFKQIGVPLRPHFKTAKSIEVARILQDHGAKSWTVSTLKEAEYLSSAHFKDILYAVSIVPQKMEQVMALSRNGAQMAICLDSPEMADQISSMKLDGPAPKVYLEVDVDGHRTGVTTHDQRAIETAIILSRAKNLEFAGLMAHGGGVSYAANGKAELEAAAEQERTTTLSVKAMLQTAGIACPHVSIGSTPTALFGTSYEGVTDVRAGVYMFQDVFQANLGMCALEDIAATVLATVISHAPHLNRIVIDAGGLAISNDRSCATQRNDCGYGFLSDVDGYVDPLLYVEGVSQEHGYITTRDGSSLPFELYPLGSQLRVLPNHSCMTVAAYEGYNLINGNHEGQWWDRCNRW